MGDATDWYAAFDLGASSARVFGGELTRGVLKVRELARFPNRPLRLPDGLHWDILGLLNQMLVALGTASEERGAPLSVGLDGWGVDYGLLDSAGRLLGLPYHYRDHRTDGMVGKALEAVGHVALYEATGIQLLQINTLYQLMAEKGLAAYEAADVLLLIPDLIGYLLTGERRCERTNATTTQCFDVVKGTWAVGLLERLGLRSDLFAPLIDPGHLLGSFRAELASDYGIDEEVRVVSVASHDTASAVLAIPSTDADVAYIACGTWSLVGVELDMPVLGEQARLANFTNEGGVDGTVRFLTNVMGLWLLQECQRFWASRHMPSEVETLLAAAAQEPPWSRVLDPDDTELLHPGDMPARLERALQRLGEPPARGRAGLIRCIVDSLAATYALSIEQAQKLCGKRIRRVHIVGGGAANGLLCQATADASGLEVFAGPLEASGVGNLLMQMRASGLLSAVETMRTLVAESFPVRHYAPDDHSHQISLVAQQRLRQMRASRLAAAK